MGVCIIFGSNVWKSKQRNTRLSRTVLNIEIQFKYLVRYWLFLFLFVPKSFEMYSSLHPIWIVNRRININFSSTPQPLNSPNWKPSLRIEPLGVIFLSGSNYSTNGNSVPLEKKHNPIMKSNFSIRIPNLKSNVVDGYFQNLLNVLNIFFVVWSEEGEFLLNRIRTLSNYN